MKRSLSIMTVGAVVLAGGLATMPANADMQDLDYTILSPYASVDWGWNQYKAGFHNHTTESDGGNSLREMIDTAYALGFNVYAATDHNVTNESWVGTYKKGPLRPGEEPKADYYYTREEVDAMLAGDGRDGAPGFLGIPNSNEQSKKDHLNTFWTPWNNTEMEDVTLEKKIEHVEGMVNAEGLQPRQHINHPGRYYGGSDKTTGEEAANDPANIQRYVGIFEKNTKALRGMEIVNKVGDGDSYSDRIIWENILAETMPEQNVWGYANDDAHSTGALGYDYNNLLMPELSEEAVQGALDSGAWYSTALVAKRELGADFKGDRWQPGPVISDIVVDEKEDTITIEGDNYNVIEWVADGEIIATGNTLDLTSGGAQP